MKVKSLRNFFAKDKRRGAMLARKIDEIFEMDPIEEGEEIYNLLQDRRIVVVDEKFIPLVSSYIALYQIFTTDEGGLPLCTNPGESLQLKQEEACKLLVSSHIKPKNPDAWVPRHLLTKGIDEEKPAKRMFDNLEAPPKRNWIRDGGKINGNY